MQELKENSEIVAGYASDNAAKAQERFAVGNRVIV